MRNCSECKHACTIGCFALNLLMWCKRQRKTVLETEKCEYWEPETVQVHVSSTEAPVTPVDGPAPSPAPPGTV
jgi:hypothetical protein